MEEQRPEVPRTEIERREQDEVLERLARGEVRLRSRNGNRKGHIRESAERFRHLVRRPAGALKDRLEFMAGVPATQRFLHESKQFFLDSHQ